MKATLYAPFIGLLLFGCGDSTEPDELILLETVESSKAIDLDDKQTRDIGQYAANPWGFFNMQGNVWEWTADRYQAAYPTGNPVIDPTRPASGSNLFLRGGSWYNLEPHLRSAVRANKTPSTRFNDLGFRVGFQKQ